VKRKAWCDARYVRFYCDDDCDWVTLSFDAQGMYALLRRRADRAGLLPLGIDGLAGLAGLIGHASIAERLEVAVHELIRKGFLELHGNAVLIPEFIESENAMASPSSRKRKEREKRRDMAMLSSVSASAAEGHASKSHQQVTLSVTPRDMGQDVTPGRHARTSRQDVTLMVTQQVTPGRHVDGHATGHVSKSLSTLLNSTDQIPPNPPKGDGSDGDGEFGEDPNLTAIREKLAKQPKPLCFLATTRAEERLYAPVISGALTTEHVLAAIDDAALTLGPELGAVQREDAQGLASVERYLAGCVKRARRDRRTDPTAQPSSQSVPRQTPRQSQPAPFEPTPEAHEALDVFREMYVSVGRYERFLQGPDDLRHAAEAMSECRNHAGERDNISDVFVGAVDSYLRDEFFVNQGHALRRFVALLRSEPGRFLGKRTTQKKVFDVGDYLYFKQKLEELEKDEKDFKAGKLAELDEKHDARKARLTENIAAFQAQQRSQRAN
jgi:hypothetical protein